MGFRSGVVAGLLREAIAFAVHLEDVVVMGQPVEERGGQPLGAEGLVPFIEGQIAGDQQLHSSHLLSDAQQPTFVSRLHQLVDQRGGGGEADRHALLAGANLRPKAMWVLPVPLAPRAITFSRRSIHSQRASSGVIANLFAHFEPVTRHA